MTVRRTALLAACLFGGLAGIAGSLNEAHRHGPRAWGEAIALAVVAFGAFAVTLRPLLVRQSGAPARTNGRLSGIATGAVLTGTFVAEAIVHGSATVALVSVICGGVVGLVLWTPTLGPKAR